MKKLALIIAPLLIASSAFAAEMPIRNITVSGMAERKVVPDEAHITITVSATNLKLETAKAEHDKKLRDVMDIAAKEDIAHAQMKTTNSSVQPVYTWENSKQLFKGYRATSTLDITVKKTDSVGDLVSKFTSAKLESDDAQGWGQFLNVSYAVAEPDKIRDEMLAEAIRNARMKAEKMASAADASVGKVIQINEGSMPSFDFPRPMPMMARAMVGAADGAAEKSIAPPAGEQQLNANVTVMFELK